jgi:6-pyruvoyl-tetrahydropterin synthase
MYRVTNSIHLHFAHHVRGHAGPCISLHGHTWMFEVTFQAQQLDAEGFVVDFDQVYAKVLQPCHDLLDHSLALGEASWNETRAFLAQMGEVLVASRLEIHGNKGEFQAHHGGELQGGRNEKPGGIKVTVFPFSPTSERLAEWLFQVAEATFGDSRVQVASARVYETLQPTVTVAEYTRAR